MEAREGATLSLQESFRAVSIIAQMGAVRVVRLDGGMKGGGAKELSGRAARCVSSYGQTGVQGPLTTRWRLQGKGQWWGTVAAVLLVQRWGSYAVW